MLSYFTLTSIICSISWNQQKCTSCENSEKSTSFSISIPSVSGSISPASPRLFIRDLTQFRNWFSNLINWVYTCTYLKLIFVNLIWTSLTNIKNKINCDECHFQICFFFLKCTKIFQRERDKKNSGGIKHLPYLPL